CTQRMIAFSRVHSSQFPRPRPINPATLFLSPIHSILTLMPSLRWKPDTKTSIAMKRILLSSLGALAGLGSTLIAAEFKLGPHTLTLLDAFAVDLAAPPSLVSRPIEADFDEQGRLYVTDSSGTNDKVAKQLIDKPHRVLRLEDTDGDGVFDKSTVF